MAHLRFCRRTHVVVGRVAVTVAVNVRMASVAIIAGTSILARLTSNAAVQASSTRACVGGVADEFGECVVSEKLPADILGSEYDWLGCDGDGNVALFSTAGGGYAPKEFLKDTNAHADAIEAILALPASTSARFAPDLAHPYVNTWKLVAERGLFAFDGDPCGDPYGPVAAPEAPVRADQLPQAAIAVLATLKFSRLRFADMTALSEQALRQGR
jgi:hypothetical protein